MHGRNLLRISVALPIFLLLGMTLGKSSAQLDSTEVRSAPTSILFITGDVARPVAVDTRLIRTMPQIQLKITNSESKSTETYSGVPLKDLLARSTVSAGKDLHGNLATLSISAIDKSGARVVLSPAEVDAVFQGRVLVADTLNGKNLGANNGPLALVIPGDQGSAHWVWHLTRIQVSIVK